MNRRKEREFVLKTLYACEFSGDHWQSQFDKFPRESKKYFTDFAIKLLDLCLEHKHKFDEEIEKQTKNWKIERLALIDRILLRVAIAEFMFFEDIPPEVTIDEAVELAKSYSTEKSGKFINGILDSIIKRFIEEHKIVKSGRGLVSKILDG